MLFSLPPMMLSLLALAAPPVEVQERFLAGAEITATKPAPGGITESKRVTLSDGTLTHDAHVQTIHRVHTGGSLVEWLNRNFVDSYQGNIAAYKLDRLLGLGMVPVSVERRVRGTRAAVTWWVDDVLMTGTKRLETGALAPDALSWRQQSDRMRVFDELIGNPDRNTGNMLITKDWQLRLIDHTRAFTWSVELQNPARMQFCDRRLLAALKALDKKQVGREMKGILASYQIDAIMARRDKIVRHFEQLVSERGETEVLYGGEPAVIASAGLSN